MSYPYNTPFNRYLTEAEMKENALYLAQLMANRGWSINAICAALGNWQSECKLNPNDPEKAGYPENKYGGFGLPQWTPWSWKYGAWCRKNGIQNIASDDNPAADFTRQLDYHDYECRYGFTDPDGEHSPTWINRGGYSYTWSQFKTSEDDISELAKAYYWQYERSGAQSVGNRADQAVAWYQFLQGVTPDPPDPPAPGWNDYLSIKCESFEVLKANCYYTITDGIVEDRRHANYGVWYDFYEPSLNLNVAVGNYVEIEFVPINFYYVLTHYTESEIETATGSFTVTSQNIEKEFISKYLKSVTNYKLDGLFVQTIDYGNYQSIKITGNIGYKDSRIYGTYSGTYGGFTLTNSQEFLGEVKCAYEKKRKPWMMALKPRRFC